METNKIISKGPASEMVTPKELVKKHIADPTHKVTEEELRKVVVGNAATGQRANRYFNEADRHLLR